MSLRRKVSNVNLQRVEVNHFLQTPTLDSTGSTRVAWLISLCVIGKQSTSRSSTLKTALSPPAVDDKGRRDNGSATAFCLDGTNLML